MHHASFRSNQYNTICTFRTVDSCCRCIFQNGKTFDFIHVYVVHVTWYTIYQNKKGRMKGDSQSIKLNRAFMVVIMVLLVVYCYLMPSDIIAKATSIFMGVTAAALLPAYFHALYSKRPNRKAAVASISVGTLSYMVLALFFNTGTSVFLPICKAITGQSVLFPDSVLASTDPLVISLPLSILTMAVALLFFRSRDLEEEPTPAL